LAPARGRDNALFRSIALAVAALTATVATSTAHAGDLLKELQTEYTTHSLDQCDRVYHFGSQGPGNVYSNYKSHSNRLVPVYTFGTKMDLGSVTGANSSYRDPERLKAIYGYLPTHTVNATAEYCDQSELYRVQRDAVKRGVKHLFVVWFDGMDWPTTQAAAIAKTGRVYTSGKGSGLIFQDYTKGSPQYGYAVTSPTHTQSVRNVDTQTVVVDAKASDPGGYDPEIAGPNPWTTGPLYPQALGYFRGGLSAAERDAIARLGRVAHAVTDSAPSAAEFASGVKSYNDSINVAPDGRTVPTLFNQIQADLGWKVGTVTSVPFCHASPAAMYAHNVDRDDYQDLAREMVGEESIVQKTRRGARLPGLDVVIGTGYGIESSAEKLRKSQGENAETGNVFLAPSTRKAIDVANGGKYVVAERTAGKAGADLLKEAAERAAKSGSRLFGLFGTKESHLPFRTADGNFDPAPNQGSDGKPGAVERYSKADLHENPSLTDMTRSAIRVLSADPSKPFALFVEAGDVDWALHSNNLDSAVGAVLSGEDAIAAIIDWVEKNSDWDESALIVSSDHGHYMVLDDPSALASRK
jgi:alkaline phosphatase